jgi:prepilin-type N-terminal cleavage/methylation domain-containing protein
MALPIPPRGFTLIELLVVVAVISAASLLAFGAFTEDRAQLRYDDTRNRIKQLRVAILGESGPAAASPAAGFVADNGILPAHMAALLQADGLQAQGVMLPLFDPTPGSDCANDGGELASPFGASPDPGAYLVKGHRGDYLGGLGFNGRFRDGWGNIGQGDDALNFGWAVAAGANAPTLSIASLGADNAPGGADYAADQTSMIAAADWRVPLEGWSIGLRSLGDLPTTHLSLSLLTFVNDAAGGRWRRYSTAVGAVCLDGDGDGLVAGSPCPSTHSFSFAAHCRAGDAGTGASIIPQGRHLLVLTRHDTTSLWQSGDAPFLRNGRYTLARIDAGAGRPLAALTLEIR